jgi:hypothetical protein
MAPLEGNPDALVNQMAQIDAALLTRSPSALDEALLLVDRKTIFEALFPASGRGGDRKSATYRAEIKTKQISFCSDAAEKLGCTERLVQLKVSMGETLAPFADDLRKTPIVDNGAALRTFAGLDQQARGGLLSIWKEAPKTSFGQALVAARLRQKADSEEVAFSRLVDSWTRAGSKARRRFLDEIGCPEDTAAALVAKWRKRGAK